MNPSQNRPHRSLERPDAHFDRCKPGTAKLADNPRSGSTFPISEGSFLGTSSASGGYNQETLSARHQTYVDTQVLLGLSGTNTRSTFCRNGFAVLNFNAWGRKKQSEAGTSTALAPVAAPNEAFAGRSGGTFAMGIVDSSRVAITGLSYGATCHQLGISHTNMFSIAN